MKIPSENREELLPLVGDLPTSEDTITISYAVTSIVTSFNVGYTTIIIGLTQGGSFIITLIFSIECISLAHSRLKRHR